MDTEPLPRNKHLARARKDRELVEMLVIAADYCPNTPMNNRVTLFRQMVAKSGLMEVART